MPWTAPQRPAAYAEQALISAILDGIYPPGSTLPGERELAVQLGVTRPTLRETLQRLGRDGWLDIQHGKSTRVTDYWQQGGLNVLNALVRHTTDLPADFVPNLLEVRLALAPAYTFWAVTRSRGEVLELLAVIENLEDSPAAYAVYDWRVHQTLGKASRNPVFSMILNGFADFYTALAEKYFIDLASRRASLIFYLALRSAAEHGDASGAREISRRAMQESIDLWRHDRFS
jgi:GntR family negative regulator for fad regulon and positive regulator of fabA